MTVLVSYLERIVFLVPHEGVSGLDGLIEPLQHLMAPRSFVEKFAPPLRFLARLLPGPHLVPGLWRAGGHPGVVRVLRVCQGLGVGVRHCS